MSTVWQRRKYHRLYGSAPRKKSRLDLSREVSKQELAEKGVSGKEELQCCRGKKKTGYEWKDTERILGILLNDPSFATVSIQSSFFHRDLTDPHVFGYGVVQFRLGHEGEPKCGKYGTVPVTWECQQHIERCEFFACRIFLDNCLVIDKTPDNEGVVQGIIQQLDRGEIHCT